MDETIRERAQIYEIGYLIAGVPEERVAAEADLVRKIVNDAGASTISEEAPRREQLAYTMRKKTVSGSYDSYDAAYFGWIKFEAGSDKIEAVKKGIEALPSILRMLLIVTVRETTYMGKRAAANAPFAAVAPHASSRRPISAPGASAEALAEPKKEAVPAAPATVEEMDKSIDEMVKEV